MLYCYNNQMKPPIISKLKKVQNLTIPQLTDFKRPKTFFLSQDSGLRFLFKYSEIYSHPLIWRT